MIMYQFVRLQEQKVLEDKQYMFYGLAIQIFKFKFYWEHWSAHGK